MKELLPPDYYVNLLRNNKPTPTSKPAVSQTQPAPVQNQPITSTVETPQYVQSEASKNLFFNKDTWTVESARRAALAESGTPVRMQSDISEKAQVSRFGAPVGSAEYYAKKAKDPYLSYLPQTVMKTVGIKFPGQETWDKMTRTDQFSHITYSGVLAAAKMIAETPKAMARVLPTYALSVGQVWYNFFTGKSTSLKDMAAEPPKELPWLGEIPTYSNVYQDARDSGLGPWAAGFVAGSFVAGDLSINAALGEAATLSLTSRSRQVLKPGEKITKTQPIKEAFTKEESRMVSKRPATNSSSDYFPLPEEFSKRVYNTSNKDTFFKITPAGESSVEISVVNLRGGLTKKPGNIINSKGLYKGDFGLERKLESQIVKLSEAPKTVQTPKKLKPIPERPLKGMADNPITPAEVGNINLIGKVNGIDDNILQTITRTLTGKSAIGELTQAEYISVGRTLSSFNNIGKYMAETPLGSFFSKALSPQRHWMRNFQVKTGIPIYDKVYVKIEEAIRVRNVFKESYSNEARQVFGKYTSSRYLEERRLVKSYLEGDKSVITNNKAITQLTKNELIEVADKMRVLWDQAGLAFGIPIEKFLKNYQSWVKNIDGIYQLYKKDSGVPRELKFYAEMKRKGNLAPPVDDALALFDIYIGTGSNKIFLNPALESVDSVLKSIGDNPVKNNITTYVQEKLGYAGELERHMNDFGKNLNKQLGLNLPDDMARQLTNIAMDTIYSGALGLSPGKGFRNYLQNMLLTYPRLGPKYYNEATKMALTKEGMKAVRDGGFLVEGGVPYGSEISQSSKLGKFRGIYRKATQASLKTFSVPDTFNRVRTYWQFKYQWDDALARYNSGKITWQRLEKEIDMRGFHPADRQIIRERLSKGDIKGAFNNAVRDVIDSTHFPYRRGSSARATFGLGGKLGTTFGQWSIEGSHTVGRWIKTGQGDKLVRLYAASAAIQRTLKETFGLDYTKSLYLGPFVSAGLSPAIKVGLDAYDVLRSWIENNEEAFEENKDEVMRSITSLGIPGGSAGRKLLSLKKSYDKGLVTSDGKYGVYSSSGQLMRTASFTDLWLETFGFSVENKEEYLRETQNTRNDQFEKSQMKRKVMELFGEEKYDKAVKLMVENNIKVLPSDFEKFYIPYTQRLYDSLPVDLKIKNFNLIVDN